MSGLENISSLQSATAPLTREQDQAVTAFLLGAVSNYIDADVWERALAWAVEHALRDTR